MAKAPKKKVKRKAVVGSHNCCGCEGKPSGVLLTCEDGVCVDILPPNFPAVLAFDPNRPGGLPYWERLENLIPAPPPPVGKVRTKPRRGRRY